MSRPPIPRIPLWEIFALITVVSLIGGLGTFLANRGESHTWYQEVLLWVPTLGFLVATLWLRARFKRRRAESSSDSSASSDS
jgi:cytochrome c-type biogenesis protein CcmH/NrfF